MARGVNKVILIGNLGADPETRYMPNGGAVTNLRIATSESWKDKETGQPQERTEWHQVVLFNRLAEIAGEYAQKGSKVYVEGSLRTRKWQDQSGVDRYTTEIVANEFQMLDTANHAASAEGNQSRQQRQPDQSMQRQGNSSRAPAPSRNQNSRQPQQGQQQNSGRNKRNDQSHSGSFDDFHPDIPFN